jgi:DNA repair exonuclease SbcCD nuclease subunit
MALIEARFDAIDAIGQAPPVHGAGHVLVAGDVFDTEGPEDRTIVQALSLSLPLVAAARQP